MSIVRKEAYFNSTNGINKVRTLIWQDDQLTPIGIVQIAHGMSEHIGRYDDFARFLASNGFIVCGNDHIGHGKSINDRSEIGYFCSENGDKRIVDDLHTLTNIMKKRNPDLPYFLFGHSMGSFCSRVYAAHFGYELTGLIICGTGEIPDISSALIPVLEKLCDKFGDMRRVDQISNLLNKGGSFLSGDGATTLSWLSANPENRLAYSNDELCGFTYTLRGYTDIFKILCEACEESWPFKLPSDLKIMIISGADDPVGTNGRGVLAVSDNLVDAGFEPNVILYPGMRHEILNEVENEQVYNDVLQFLQSCYTNN
ncbi:MAG: lysophospholipase [Clostridiales bacterium]|nr:lysophospholipase [Clostridiales bacterium]